MWIYEKRLEYPVNITEPNADIAKLIISQYGGPDGEIGASMRYLSQRFAAPNRVCMAVLTDVGNEGLLLHTLRSKESVSGRFLWSLECFKSEIFWRTKIHFCGSKFNFTSTRWSG